MACSQNIAQGPAMTREQAITAIRTGYDLTRNAPSMTSPGSFMALSTWLR